MHRAEDDITYVLVGVFGSNSYKGTEQKETFLCFLGMGNNPMVGATVAVAVATAEAMNK